MEPSFVTCPRCGFDTQGDLDENNYCWDCRMMAGPPKPPPGVVLPPAMRKRLEA